MRYSGWNLQERAELLTALVADKLPPSYELVDCEHVTYAYPSSNPAPPVTRAEVVGWRLGVGIDALVVAIDGSTLRSDGWTYHLTYSLAPGHTAAESKALLAQGWTAVGPYPITLQPFLREIP